MNRIGYIVCFNVLHVSGTRSVSEPRSFRLPPHLRTLLEKEAQEKGVSMNSLVTSILTRYVEWDRYADRFGFVTISRAGLRSIHEALSPQALEKLAREIGSQNPKEATLSWFKRLGLEPFLKYLVLQCRYGKIAECEIEHSPKETTILLHHPLGGTYSRWLELWITQAIRSVTGLYPTCQAGENSIVVHIPRPVEGPPPR